MLFPQATFHLHGKAWARGALMAGLVLMASAVRASEYQWSVPVEPTIYTATADHPAPRAYLWIPDQCRQVRAVVVGQHNMLEENILEHPEFRKTMRELGIAEVWITPALDGPFNPEKTGDRFNAMMKDLAEVSGYQELAFAPIAPIGHSAAASYPWNFAAWAPERTLAALSIHGDAPMTPIAGYGKATTNWGDRTIDGVPGLMVMGEYEWIEARLAPAIVYRFVHPKAPIAVLAEPGEGHFAACDDLIQYLDLFLRKCVEQRLPPLAETPLDRPPVLKPIDPAQGWLVQRWYLHHGRTVEPGPYATYGGDSVDAFWAFDKEMADATQNYHSDMVEKKPQLIGYVQNGQVVPAGSSHAMVNLKFIPNADGESFTLGTTFLDHVTRIGPEPSGVDRDVPGKNNHVRWTALPAGSPIGHATGGGPIVLHRIEGPVEQTGPETFRLSFYRGYTPRQAIWLAAEHPGDGQYKSAVQQASMPVPINTSGVVQTIIFPAIPDQQNNAASLPLVATSSAGLPVHFYVREGPAEVEGDTLKFLPIPPRAKFPMKITVVAWQWGHATDPKVKTAAMVEQTFNLVRPGAK